MDRQYYDKVETRSLNHDPVVLSQFDECLKMAPSRLLIKLAQPGRSNETVREETIVILTRHYAAKACDGIAWKLLEILAGRVSLSLGRSIRLWRLEPLEAEEVIEAVTSNLYNSVLSNSERDKFWEVRFWVCFDRHLLSTVRSTRNRRDKTSDFDTDDVVYSDRPLQEIHGQLRWDDPSFRVVIAEALGELPEHIRTAFMLKHWAGFPESSRTASDESTISTIMGVSDRTVRNYLKRAEYILSKWRVPDGDSDGMGDVG